MNLVRRLGLIDNLIRLLINILFIPTYILDLSIVIRN